MSYPPLIRFTIKSFDDVRQALQSLVIQIGAHVHSAADITSGLLALARGGTHTDLSATGGTGKVLKQKTVGGDIAVETLAESEVVFTDITTNNASTAKHGYLKKLDNTVTNFLDGTGNWSVPAGTYTNENAQDAVGGILTDSATIDFTYDDAANTITAIIIDSSVGNSKLASMAAATVKGRAAGAGTGIATDLTAAQLLAIILTADGAGSGLDADLLDGLSSAAFALASHTHTSVDITDFTEAAQDAIAASLLDSTTIDFTYNDGSNTITAIVIDASITLAKMANIATATFIGRISALSGVPEALTVTQATSMLNAMVGDSGAGGTKGLVPAPGVGDAAALKFLKADGTWAVPAGSSSDVNAQCMAWVW